VAFFILTISCLKEAFWDKIKSAGIIAYFNVSTKMSELPQKKLREIQNNAKNPDKSVTLQLLL
jgi:hypothetical protein